MAKIKLIIESNKEYDTSYKGIALGIYTYYPPGPWAAKVVEFILELNDKLIEHDQTKHCLKCYISEIDGPKAVVIIKGKKEDALSAINVYLTKSEILKYFTVSVK